jgi:hypothetical protein
VVTLICLIDSVFGEKTGGDLSSSAIGHQIDTATSLSLTVKRQNFMCFSFVHLFSCPSLFNYRTIKSFFHPTYIYNLCSYELE